MTFSYSDELKLRYDQLKNLDNLSFITPENRSFYKKYIQVRIYEIQFNYSGSILKWIG